MTTLVKNAYLTLVPKSGWERFLKHVGNVDVSTIWWLRNWSGDRRLRCDGCRACHLWRSLARSSTQQQAHTLLSSLFFFFFLNAWAEMQAQSSGGFWHGEIKKSSANIKHFPPLNHLRAKTGPERSVQRYSSLMRNKYIHRLAGPQMKKVIKKKPQLINPLV